LTYTFAERKPFLNGLSARGDEAMPTHYQRKVERNKLGRELKSLGCPYWPDPTSPQALAWIEGNQAGVDWAREQAAKA
jgi:hypothetical protein